MSFCSPSSFPASDCCFACVSLHIPVLPFSSCTSFNSLYFPFYPALPFPKSFSRSSSSALPFISLYPFIPCTSFPSCISLFRTSHICPALPLPKSCWACPLRVPPPAYFLPFTLLSRTSLYCVLYVFLPSFFTWIFLKILFIIDDLLFYWFGPCLSNVVVFALNLKHLLCLFAFCWSFLDEFVCNWLLFCLFLEFIASAVTVCIFVVISIDFSKVIHMSQAWGDARKIT